MSHMRDILLIRASSDNIGGVEGQILLIAKGLASLKLFNPVLATSRGNSSLKRRFEGLGFPVYEVLKCKDQRS